MSNTIVIKKEEKSVIKIFAIVAALLAMTVGVQAQQRAMYSQYMMNKFLINPAYAGENDFFEASTNFRHQWVGIVDAPRTYAITVNGPITVEQWGVGGGIYNDVTGPTSKSGIFGTSAYHLHLNDELRIALGVSAGIMQYKVDGTKVTVFDPGDQIISNARLTSIVPDIGAGIKFYKRDKFHVGLSVPQAMQSDIVFVDNQPKLSNLVNHVFLNGGYIFKLNDDFNIEPSALVKFSPPGIGQLDVGTRIMYRQLIWLGAVYRTEDAFSAIVGFSAPNNKIHFGYAYDFTTSNLKNYSFGTHEIMITARFGEKSTYQRKGKNKRNELQELMSQMEDEEQKARDREEEIRREKARQKEIKDSIQVLVKKDKELREKVRFLREQAKLLGFDSPKNENYGRRIDYLNLLEDIKSNYAKKEDLEKQLK